MSKTNYHKPANRPSGQGTNFEYEKPTIYRPLTKRRFLREMELRSSYDNKKHRVTLPNVVKTLDAIDRRFTAQAFVRWRRDMLCDAYANADYECWEADQKGITPSARARLVAKWDHIIERYR